MFIITHPSSNTFDLRYALPVNVAVIHSLIIFISVYWRFVHFHGQKTSRQNRYKSIYKDSGHKRTKSFRLVSVILFFSPDAHLRELKKVWADERIFEGVWKNFMQKLVSEWTDFVLYVSCADLKGKPLF